MTSHEEIFKEGPVTLQIYHSKESSGFILLVHAEYQEIGKEKIAARFDELSTLLSKMKQKIREALSNDQ